MVKVISCQRPRSHPGGDKIHIRINACYATLKREFNRCPQEWELEDENVARDPLFTVELVI